MAKVLAAGNHGTVVHTDFRVDVPPPIHHDAVVRRRRCSWHLDDVGDSQQAHSSLTASSHLPAR
jgi:hypothetical protein